MSWENGNHHAPTDQDIALRQKRYGTVVLETLFASFRESEKEGTYLPKGAIIKLDAERHKPWLLAW